MAAWADVPHLTEEIKNEIRGSIPPYQIDAVERGWPILGSGAIYPLAEDSVKVQDFPLPAEWPRAYGMDVGWDWTVAAFFAHDPAANLYYLYAAYVQGKQEPSSHAAAIRTFGPWIPGVIDPAANGRSQKDGMQLLRVYRDLGLNVTMARNSVEGGILKVYQMLHSGALKVFASVKPFFEEFRQYRRDMNGNVVKKHDHVLDGLRYWCLSGMDLMKSRHLATPAERKSNYELPPGAWMI